MNTLGRTHFWLVLRLAVRFVSNLLPAAERLVGASPLPPARSPVDYFRELLAMNPAERRTALTNRAPESQRRILDKVQEYQSLNPEERELRLRATELHYYLTQLLGTSATNRHAQLALIPQQTR